MQLGTVEEADSALSTVLSPDSLATTLAGSLGIDASTPFFRAIVGFLPTDDDEEEEEDGNVHRSRRCACLLLPPGKGVGVAHRRTPFVGTPSEEPCARRGDALQSATIAR